MHVFQLQKQWFHDTQQNAGVTPPPWKRMYLYFVKLLKTKMCLTHIRETHSRTLQIKHFSKAYRSCRRNSQLFEMCFKPCEDYSFKILKFCKLRGCCSRLCFNHIYMFQQFHKFQIHTFPMGGGTPAFCGVSRMHCFCDANL